MQIGHICLATEFDDRTRQLTVLVRSLVSHSINQQSIVANHQLAVELEKTPIQHNVRVARSPISAYCAARNCDLLHLHDEFAGRTGLLATLTRGTPYVLTYRGSKAPPADALNRSIFSRAAGIVCDTAATAELVRHAHTGAAISVIEDAGHDDRSAQQMSAKYVRVYRGILDSRAVPGLLL